MTMTSLVKTNRQFRTAVRTHTQRPEIDKHSAILTEPRSKRYGLVGTAFDYLVGFTLEHLNPGRREVTPLPICVRSLLILNNQIRTAADKENTVFCERAVAHMLNQAETYIETGRLTRNFVASLIQVSQLDQIYRSGVMPRMPLAQASKANIEDIIELYERMPIDQLKATQKVYVAPDFGMSSQLVGGADADFIIDGRLIDTKTSIDLKIPLDMWCQLVGYYLLNRMESANGGRIIEIHKIGIYFARYGMIVEVDAEEAITDMDYLTEVMITS